MKKDIDYAVHDDDINHELTIELFDKIKHLEEQICRSFERADVGRFYGGKQLIFFGKSESFKRKILSVIKNMDFVELSAEHAKFEEECRISHLARKEFLSLNPAEFVFLLEKTSNQKLVNGQALQFNSQIIALKAGASISEIKFKRLARTGLWNKESQCYEFVLPLTENVRDRLFSVAKAFGRPKKKMTATDVVNPTPSRLEKPRGVREKLNMDFAECSEDFGLEYAIEMQKSGRLID